MAAPLGGVDGLVAVLGIEALLKAFLRYGALQVNRVILDVLFLNVGLQRLDLRRRVRHKSIYDPRRGSTPRREGCCQSTPRKTAH